MSKVTLNESTGRFSVTAKGKGPQAVIRESASGKVLALKGYGALSGEYTVREGVDLSKPIAAQAVRVKSGKKAVRVRKSA